MKLQVEQAKEHMGTPISFGFTEPATVLGAVEAFPWSRHDITISGEFWFDGRNYVVKGMVQREGDYECTRCLKPVHHVMSIPFEELYNEDARAEAFGDAVPFSGDSIDITELIRETVIINEPSQVLCQEDCKGLCVQCGANLNDNPCSCESFVVDPRFAALQALIDKSDD